MTPYTLCIYGMIAALTFLVVYNHVRLQRLLNEREDEVRRHQGFRRVPKHLAQPEADKVVAAEALAGRQVGSDPTNRTKVRSATMRARKRITTR